MIRTLIAQSIDNVLVKLPNLPTFLWLGDFDKTISLDAELLQRGYIQRIERKDRIYSMRPYLDLLEPVTDHDSNALLGGEIGYIHSLRIIISGYEPSKIKSRKHANKNPYYDAFRPRHS